MMQAKGSYFLFVRATYTSPEHLSHHVKRINCFLLDDLYPFGSVTSSRVPWDKFWPPASSSGIPPLNVPKWNSERRLPLPPRETAPPVSHADRHSPKSWAFSLLSSRLVLHQHPVLLQRQHPVSQTRLPTPPAATALRNQGLGLRMQQSGRGRG